MQHNSENNVCLYCFHFPAQFRNISIIYMEGVSNSISKTNMCSYVHCMYVHTFQGKLKKDILKTNEKSWALNGQKMFDYCQALSLFHHWNCYLKPIWFLHWKHIVNFNWGHFSPPLSAIGSRDNYLVVDLIIRQSV